MSHTDPNEARLRLRSADGEEMSVSLHSNPFTIGRLRDNDLKIADSHVSRVHAEIVKEGDEYRIVDRNSKSGTYVNGQRIQSQILHHGDCILLGRKALPEIIFLTQEEVGAAQGVSTSSVTSSFLIKDSSADLQHVSRFLEGLRLFSGGVPRNEILDVVLDMAIEISGADRAFLVLVDQEGSPSFRNGRNRNKESLQPEQFQISRTVLNEVLDKGERRIMNQQSHPEALSTFESAVQLELRTVVCLPLRGMEEKVIGALYLDSREATRGLSSIREGLLASLAKDAGSVLVNMTLLDQAREKDLLDLELETAREIQESLLPEIRGSYGFFEASAENRPSRGISGDYYDLIPLPQGRFGVVIADISGKGIPAAILTSLVQGALYAEITRNSGITTCVENVNRFLVRRSGTNRFVSLFLAMLSPGGQLDYVNAGHNPPIRVRTSGETSDLTARGMVLGVVEDVTFEQAAVQLEVGDVVCFYTDGVTEARNSDGEFFGEDRLRASLSSGPRSGAEALMDHVLSTVANYTGETPRSDDLTLLMIRRIE